MPTKQLANHGLDFSNVNERSHAIEVLARRCGPRACAIARARVGNAAQAEELVQEALARTFERLEQLRDEGSLDAWFYRILHRLCLDAIRKRTRWQRIARFWRDEPIAHANVSEDRDRVLAAVAALPEKQHVAVVLRYGRGLSVKDVAAAMQIEPATAKTHLDRGLKKMRTLLGVDDE